MYPVYKAIEIDSIKSTVESLPFDKRFEMRALAQKVLSIIDGFEFKGDYIDLSSNDFRRHKYNLNTTINSEVYEIERLPSKPSESQFFTFGVNRRRLMSDIEVFSDQLRRGIVRSSL